MRSPKRPPGRSRDGGRRRTLAEHRERFLERCRRRRQLRFAFDKYREE